MSVYLEKFKKIAIELDLRDSLKEYRGLFAIPKGISGRDKVYFCSNSLGLPPLKAFELADNQLKQWAKYGVEGWLKGNQNWYTSLDMPLRKPLARLLGAKDDEVVVMNSLTINLHLLLVSFYCPTNVRYKILIDAPTFPSDLYALKSQIRFRGFDPADVLLVVEPRSGEQILREEDIQQLMDRQGEEIALVLLSPVNFLTGQILDMKKITSLAHNKGALVGFDVAHAAGNIPLNFHDWGVDFAVGCSYKYLCSGPGGPGFSYVHQKHHRENVHRFSGWWGNNPNTRFKMQLQSEFIPYGGANSWQVSTPSILSLMPLLASLEIFEDAGIEEIREKSKLQISFLQEILDAMSLNFFSVITPREAEKRGCQLSLLFAKDGERCLKHLEEHEIVCDFRAPNVIRVAPFPLYNTFFEIYHFAKILTEFNP